MPSGTMPGEEIECQFQGLDRSELGRRKWPCIRAREKDLEGEEEYGIGNLGQYVKRFTQTFMFFGRWKGLRTTGSQF